MEGRELERAEVLRREGQHIHIGYPSLVDGNEAAAVQVLLLDRLGGRRRSYGAVIQRANLNGSGVEDLVTAGLDFPWGITLDLTPSASTPGSGDVNGDGKLTITDALLIAQHVVGETTVDEATADRNGDGKVTITDALLVAQEVVGLI